MTAKDSETAESAPEKGRFTEVIIRLDSVGLKGGREIVSQALSGFIREAKGRLGKHATNLKMWNEDEWLAFCEAAYGAALVHAAAASFALLKEKNEETTP